MNNLNERLEAAKDNAVLQAQIWAQEARTQRATALDILRYFGLPEHDWEALRLIQRAGIAGVAPPRGPSISQDEETVRAWGEPRPGSIRGAGQAGDTRCWRARS
jgi:hypothetical protein